MKITLMPIKDAPSYFIATDGRVFKELHPWLDQKGYRVLTVSVGNLKSKRPIHQAILESFGFERPSPLHVVRHLNGDKTKNFKNNLRWGTVKENVADKVRHGKVPKENNHWSRKKPWLVKKGCSHHMAKLTPENVKAIRLDYTNGKTQSALSREYFTSKSLISLIVNRYIWKSVL